MGQGGVAEEGRRNVWAEGIAGARMVRCVNGRGAYFELLADRRGGGRLDNDSWLCWRVGLRVGGEGLFERVSAGVSQKAMHSSPRATLEFEDTAPIYGYVCIYMYHIYI